jgi:hypothetical protein
MMPGGGLEPPTRGFSALKFSVLTMTAFTTAQLPGGIYAPTSVEELLVWANGVLQFNNPTDSYTEAANSSRLYRFIQPEMRTYDQELVLINRAVTIVDETKAQNLPRWKRVGEFSNTVIPAGFKITA